MEPQKYSNQTFLENVPTSSALWPKESSDHSQSLPSMNNNHDGSTTSIVPLSDADLSQGSFSNISHLINLPDSSSFYLDEINLEQPTSVAVEHHSNDQMISLTNLNFVHLQQTVQMEVNECREGADGATSSMGHGDEISTEGTAINNEARTATGNSNMNTQFVPQIDSSSTSNAIIDIIL